MLLNKLYNLEQDKIIFHLSLVKDVKLATPVLEILYNPKIDKWSKFQQRLKKYNDIGYNIYFALNDFHSKRRRKANISRFRGFMIDIDGDNVDKEALYLELLNTCCKTQINFGIQPNYIVETYKGFHILFMFHQDIGNLKEEAYMNLFHFFNEVYKGDKRFKPITGMVKAPGFIDHKDNRNFQIKLKDYTKGKQLIDLESLLRFFSLGGEIDKKKLLNCEEQKKKEKVQGVELIDAKDLIAVLNDKYNSGEEGFYFDIKLGRDKISIRGTDGLKLFYNETTKKYTFRDFSEKGRFGILGFLWNYYFEFNKGEFQEGKKFLTKFFKENFNIVLADNEINYFARFCRNEVSRDYTNVKGKKLIPLLPLQRFLQKKWIFQDGRKAGIEELKKYLKIFDLRRVDSDLAIRYSKDDFINLVGEIGGCFDEVSNSITNKENSLFNIEIFNKQKSDTNIPLIQYKKNNSEYLLDLSCNGILYKKNTQLLISENVYNYIMSLRSLDKIIFLFDILIGFQINEALTYNITHSGFTNKKYIYQVLKESGILEDVPAYTIQGDYLFVGNKHWIEKIKNKT